MPDKLCGEILNSLPFCVFVTDRNRRLVFSNKSFKDTFKPEKDSISVGSSLNCAALLNNEECGKGSACKNCMLMKLLRESARNGKKIMRRMLDKKIRDEKGIKNYRIKLSVIPLNKGLFCCVFEDVAEISDTAFKVLNKRMNRDLKRAKAIQANLLPAPSKIAPLAEFTYYYKQFFDVGGDIFDVYKFDGSRYGGYIADVSGSGVSGGMLTVYLHGNYPSSVFSPAESLENLSQKFSALNFSEDYYITIFSFAVDTQKKELRVCNAGHNIPAIIKRKDNAEIIYIRGRTISNWYEGKNRYNDTVLSYEKGDILILMTDGLPDMKNSDGRVYTFDRIKNIITKSGARINNLLKKIEIDMIEFSDGKLSKDADDIALLLIQL